MKQRKRIVSFFLAVISLLTCVLHADIVTAPASSYPKDLLYESGAYYFIAYPAQPEPFSNQLARLWKTDGTSAGTVMLSNIGVESTNICGGPNLVLQNGRLIFVGKDESSGKELWTFDLKTQKSALIKDIYQGKTDSLACMLSNANGTLFFSAFDNPQRASLWKTDGTPAGTIKLKERLSPREEGSSTNAFIAVENAIFFVADDGIHGFELWKSDGTSAGTFLVKDFASGAADANIGSFANIGKTVYFAADDGKFGTELWKTDGTLGGTVLVKDIVPGKSGSNPSALTNIGNILYFGTERVGWWKSDGTSQGTVKVGPHLHNVFSFIILKGSLIVVGREKENDDAVTLWKASADDGSSKVLKEFVNLDSLSLTVFNDELYFDASDCQQDGLWKTDGTSAGTLFVLQINPDSVIYQGKDSLFFAADDGIHGDELWKSDGTAKGTMMVKDIAPGSGKRLYIPPPPRSPNYQSPCDKFNARHGAPSFASAGAKQTQTVTASPQDKPGQNGLDENSVIPINTKELQQPELLLRVPPAYPEIAQKARIQGTVQLECLIDKSGNVTVQKVLKSVHPLLDKAAIETVSQWKYKPATLNGKPVKVVFTTSLKFRLIELFNQDIVDLVKSGSGEENVIQKIESARNVKFDLSPDQLKSLIAQGVSKKIIAAMQKKQSEMEESQPSQ